MSAELISRITAYLSGGGLFNPELAIHDAVRDLLIDCRTALSEPAAIGDAKVVPLEPTEAMLMAGYYPNFEKAKRREMYQAMLAAAPAEAASITALGNHPTAFDVPAEAGEPIAPAPEETAQSSALAAAYVAERDALLTWKERALAAEAVSKSAQIDPGTEKLLRGMLDRVYKIFLMSGMKVTEQDSDSNDPIIAWMSDARHVLYGSGRQPDVIRDLQGVPK